MVVVELLLRIATWMKTLIPKIALVMSHDGGDCIHHFNAQLASQYPDHHRLGDGKCKVSDFNQDGDDDQYSGDHDHAEWNEMVSGFSHNNIVQNP